MCTVTFIPQPGRVIITSNRDEKTARPAAFSPAEAIINGKKVLFPKDAKAGGTWFVAAENGTVAVLLNGAFVPHIPKEKYRKSRGLVLLDIVTDIDPAEALAAYDLTDIEPFTVLLFISSKLREMRWDGAQRYIKEIPADEPHIYSSVTLYPREVIAQREDWFTEFMKSSRNIEPDQVRRFHATAGHGDNINGLVMNRNNITKTFSITQAVVGNAEIDFYHHDLISGTEDHKVLRVLQKHNRA